MKDSELKMAIQLAGMGAADEFHPENYRDEVQERIRATIQRKIDGEEISAADAEEPKAQVIDLMEALRASLAGSRPRAREAASPKSSAKIPIKAEAKRRPAKPVARKVANAKSRSR